MGRRRSSSTASDLPTVALVVWQASDALAWVASATWVAAPGIAVQPSEQQQGPQSAPQQPAHMRPPAVITRIRLVTRPGVRRRLAVQAQRRIENASVEYTRPRLARASTCCSFMPKPAAKARK